jgi:hypothetical protein
MRAVSPRSNYRFADHWPSPNGLQRVGPCQGRLATDGAWTERHGTRTTTPSF